MKRFVLFIFFISLLIFVILGLFKLGKVIFKYTEPVKSLDFIPPGKTFYLSVKNAKDIFSDFNIIRNQKLPVLSWINRYLYYFEYVIDHRLTYEDLVQLAGEDFTVQFWPNFIFVTRTLKEYNAFFYLNIRNDKEFRYSGIVMHEKFIPPLKCSIYYTFFNDWLIVSDSKDSVLKSIKFSGRHFFNAPQKVLQKSRLFIGWNGKIKEIKNDVEESLKFFQGILNKDKNVIICGENLNLLYVYPQSDDDEKIYVSSDSILSFRFDYKLIFKDFVGSKSEGVVSMIDCIPADGFPQGFFIWHIPSGISSKELNNIVNQLRDLTQNSELMLAQEMMDNYHVLYDGKSIIPRLNKERTILFFDGSLLSSLEVFDTDMNNLLKRIGKVEIRR